MMFVLTNFILMVTTLITTMTTDLDQIKKAAEGLSYMSETDSGFEVFQLPAGTNNLQEQLLSISGKEAESAIEEQELEYFFRNMVKIYPESTADQKQTAERFLQLQKVLKEQLAEIKVYRIGAINIDAFIVGKLKDGTYVVLKTALVET